MLQAIRMIKAGLSVLAILLLAGCATDRVWDNYNSERALPKVEQITEASIDKNGWFHVRVKYRDGITRAFIADVSHGVEGNLQATEVIPMPTHLPKSIARIRVLSGEEANKGRNYPKSRKTPRNGERVDYPEEIGLMGPDWVRIWIVDKKGNPLQLVWLPRRKPSNAWLETKTWTLTVGSVIFDVVTFPIQFAHGLYLLSTMK